MDAEDHKAHARSDPREHLLRDIRIDDSFEVMNKEAALVFSRAGTTLEPLLGDRQRTRPRPDLHQDAPKQRTDVKPSQRRPVAGQNPPENHPQNPEDMDQQNEDCQNSDQSHNPNDTPSCPPKALRGNPCAKEGHYAIRNTCCLVLPDSCNPKRWFGSHRHSSAFSSTPMRPRLHPHASLLTLWLKTYVNWNTHSCQVLTSICQTRYI